MKRSKLSHYPNLLSEPARAERHAAGKLKFLIAGVFWFVLLGFSCSKNEVKRPLNGLQWAIRMAESVVIRHPDNYYKWDYVTGTVLRGFEELWLLTGERKYFEYIKKSVDFSVHADGSIDDYKRSDFNMDEINEGRLLLFLFKETGQERYKHAADLIRSQLDDQPRNSRGGFWHKKKYPYQMWLDGLYMGAPFYTEYTQLFDDDEKFDDMALQFVLSENHMREPRSGLLYHGWDEKRVQEWADAKTGTSRVFWARAMGWYAMALVDVLDYLPEDHAKRESLIQIFKRLAKAVRKKQDRHTGLWWQVIDSPKKEGNYLEASASGMFVYAFAKGVRKGYLSEDYRETAEKAYRGILDTFISENPDGTLDLNGICKSAGLGYGRDGSYDYYVRGEPVVANDGKGVGPFITASIEIYKLNRK